jgi:hypothetical protein
MGPDFLVHPVAPSKSFSRGLSSGCFMGQVFLIVIHITIAEGKTSLIVFCRAGPLCGSPCRPSLVQKIPDLLPPLFIWVKIP